MAGGLPGFDCVARLLALEHGRGEAEPDATASLKTSAGSGASRSERKTSSSMVAGPATMSE